jgi:hypothetical protein
VTGTYAGSLPVVLSPISGAAGADTVEADSASGTTQSTGVNVSAGSQSGVNFNFCFRRARKVKEAFLAQRMKIMMILLTSVVAALSGYAVYAPSDPGVVVVSRGKPQGGPGNGFCPPVR